MDYIFNKEKIKELLLDFYLSTGIAVTFYDSSTKMVATSPVYCEWCKKIRSDNKRQENCNLSNLTHMNLASRTKQTVCYTCHTGLMEAIIPVLYEDTLIGYMQIGQFRDQNKVYSSLDMALSRIEEYGLDRNELLPLYESLPLLSSEKFEAVKRILLVLIKSFWDDALIRHNRSMLSVKIEQYIEERLLEKISVESICKHFFISKNALYRLFSEEFNTTIGKYLLTKRINLAMEKLTKTNLAITAISLECGFTDYNYFIRAFKKQTGITPLQFRKNK